MTTEWMEKAKAWTTNTAIDEEAKNRISKLIEQDNHKELEECFYKDLEFGTGGIRAILGDGTNRLNKYNIRKAAYALCLSVKKISPEGSIVISYDSRNFSFEFAKNAAEVFAASGLKALIYNRLNPVPLCSFAIRHHKSLAGVMVTASHNPPEYNGFKVFWSDGAQVTPPHDGHIISAFNNIQDYSDIPFIDFDEGISTGSIEWIGEETEQAYFNAIKSKAINADLCAEKGSELKIVYTALHGTGFTPCTQALRDLGLNNIYSVPEQEKPDGDFPTVSSPNPENPEALALAVKLMQKENADLALGTDPDTDRVGIAFTHEGETKYLNGNQIGLLMLHYLLSQHHEKGTLPKNPYFVKTIVTTALQEKIANAFGVTCENTLTGFKWICGRMNEIEHNEPERNFVFATEESFGYLNHEYVRDKDGVSSITLLCEMALYHKLKNKNLLEALDDIYAEYGFSHETLLSLNYYGKEGSEKIARIMSHFREHAGTPLAGQSISSFEDYLSGQVTNLETKEKSELGLPSSNVLGFSFTSGDRLYLRPSGTEPKIKFYIMMQENEGTLSEKKTRAEAKTDAILAFIKEKAHNI